MQMNKLAPSVKARSQRSVPKSQSRKLNMIVRSERKFTDQQWEDAVKGATSEPTTTAAPSAAKAISFGDAMAFSGPVPETVNGRLAMLGFLAAVGAEVASGESVFQQLSDAPVAIGAAFLAFAVASLVPILKGANLKEAFGPFTPSAELLNGRAAMIGLVGVLAVEYFKGSALF